MFNSYLDSNSVLYNLLFNEINNNKLSHAYLFDENNNSNAYDIVISFVKAILCKDYLKDDHDVDNCLVCKRINDRNYSELKIIEATGSLIKKEQILELQKDFSRSSIENNRRVYIIRDCDKMRPETANAMLKFLEEPDNNVIAILMTNNFNNILSTIISRCQIIKLNGQAVINYSDELINIGLDFVYNLEKNGRKILLNIKDILYDKIDIKDRNFLSIFLDLLIDIYYDIYKLMNGINCIKLDSYNDRLLMIIDVVKNPNVLKKIDILLDYKDNIKYNVNINLLFDCLIVDFGV